MEGFPKLPGLDFSSALRQRHHVSHSNLMKNGFMIRKVPLSGIGNESLEEKSVLFQKPEDGLLYDPVFTYGRVQAIKFPPFQPDYVKFDKMILTFYAYFKEILPDDNKQGYRIRQVNILVFLEDDTITVIEPAIMNCGMLQGRLVRRGKVSKNFTEFYTWKDFNIGIDMKINGYLFHINDCDHFTKEFLISQGVDVNEPEMPLSNPDVVLPRSINRQRKEKIFSTQSSKKDDKLLRLLRFSGQILTFDILLDESTPSIENTLTYTLYFYLEDGTISIRELHENREGRDRFPMFLKRSRVPLESQKKLEISENLLLESVANESKDYFEPQHLIVGQTANIYGRQFLLLDCDKYTRNYYENTLHINQPPRVCKSPPEKRHSHLSLPDYLGLGTPEDSLASHIRLRPKAPRKDIIKYLQNSNKVLRYLTVLDSAHPEDSIRKFILTYNLADDTLSIIEPPINNSGIIGGKFLSSCKIKKPDSDPRIPLYYSPKDMYIGALLTINDHRFRITGVDLFVYRYMKEFPELFTDDIVHDVQSYLLYSSDVTDDVKAMIRQDMIPIPEENYDKEKDSIPPVIPEPEQIDDGIDYAPDFGESKLPKLYRNKKIEFADEQPHRQDPDTFDAEKYFLDAKCEDD